MGEDSASYPGVGEILPVRADHLEICKFDPKDSTDAERYKVVKEKILKLIKGETVLQDTAVSTRHTFHFHVVILGLTDCCVSMGFNIL